jgi:hypothetical protein
MSIRPARSFVGRLVIDTISSQHALNSANDTADRRTDNGADRTSAAVALIRAMGEAAGNSLRLGSNRYRNDCKDCGRNQNS